MTKGTNSAILSVESTPSIGDGYRRANITSTGWMLAWMVSL